MMQTLTERVVAINSVFTETLPQYLGTLRCPYCSAPLSNGARAHVLVCHLDAKQHGMARQDIEAGLWEA